MSLKIAPTAQVAVYSGTHGNASRETLNDVLAATPADTKILLGNFPAGTTFDGVTVFHDALGAGTSIELGIKSKHNDDINELTLFGTVNTTDAGDALKNIKPRHVNETVELIATLKGGVGTGELQVTVNYRYNGISTY